jgi:hypothetical protein
MVHHTDLFILPDPYKPLQVNGTEQGGHITPSKVVAVHVCHLC